MLAMACRVAGIAQSLAADERGLVFPRHAGAPPHTGRNRHQECRSQLRKPPFLIATGLCISSEALAC